MLSREPRILFLAPGNYPDYQCDGLLHGLKSLLGDRVIDAVAPWYMYQPTDANRDQFRSLYGKGFTLYGLLPHSASVDRSDIADKIRGRHFDLIVYGSIHRSQQHLSDVLENYPAERICYVDGEDGVDFYRFVVGRGRYFKRELLEHWIGSSGALKIGPIGFGIPKEKVVAGIPAKQRVLAHIDPRDKRTYIYDTEEGYYKGYQESCFGITTKKAGWDCMRHYEILANGCFPFFLDLPQFPSTVMTHYPKRQMLWAYETLTSGRCKAPAMPSDEYLSHLDAAMSVLRRNCTTEAIAKTFLERCADGY